jgi:hypothetical protein
MPGDHDKVAALEGQVTTLETQLVELSKKLAKAQEGGDTESAKELQEELQKATASVEAAAEAIETLTKERDDARAIAKMTPEEREFHASLTGEDQDAFLAKSTEDRSKEMKKKAESDETVQIDGQTIKKSAVGEGVFQVLKAQSDRIAKTEKDLSAQKEANDKITFEKAAEDKYPHVPGTAEERGKMLKAVSEIKDEAVRKLFDKVFEQSEKLAKNAFGKLGSDNSGTEKDQINKAAHDFTAKVNEIKGRDKCTQGEALAKARKEHPDLFKAYQGNPEQTSN